MGPSLEGWGDPEQNRVENSAHRTESQEQLERGLCVGGSLGLRRGGGHHRRGLATGPAAESPRGGTCNGAGTHSCPLGLWESAWCPTGWWRSSHEVDNPVLTHWGRLTALTRWPDASGNFRAQRMRAEAASAVARTGRRSERRARPPQRPQAE